jgi:hypothetical protein
VVKLLVSSIDRLWHNIFKLSAIFSEEEIKWTFRSAFCPRLFLHLNYIVYFLGGFVVRDGLGVMLRMFLYDC